MSDNEPGNKALRTMSTGRARSLCKLELREDEAGKAAYRRWCDDNGDELRTMGSSYRGLSGQDRIPSRYNR